MELPMKTLVILMLCLVAALLIVLLMTGFTGQTEDVVGSFFDFFTNLLGFGG